MDPVPAAVTTAVRAAVQRAAAAGAELRSVVAVEGDSDRSALEALARRLGRDLETEGIAVVPLGGATNLGHFLRVVAADGMDVRVGGLCDADEERGFRRHLEATGFGRDLDRAGMEALGFFVCEADLEDELIRALGVTAVEGVVAAQGELGSFETFRRQPAQRDRPVGAQLRRFLGYPLRPQEPLRPGPGRGARPWPRASPTPCRAEPRVTFPSAGTTLPASRPDAAPVITDLPTGPSGRAGSATRCWPRAGTDDPRRAAPSTVDGRAVRGR